MPYDLGDTVRLVGECRDPGGLLVSASTAVLTVTLPDGSTATPTVPAPNPAGTYTVDYPTVQSGRHLARWVWTVPAAAYTDAFDVRQADPGLILSLEDSRQHLKIRPTDHTFDAKIRSLLESITTGIEFHLGPVVPRTVVELHDGGGLLALRRPPVLSLVSMAPARSTGITYSVSDMDFDPLTGAVWRLDGGPIRGPQRVSYRAGRTQVPAAAYEAGCIILGHLWRPQQGADGMPAMASDDYAVTEPAPGFGYAIPNRALELLVPLHRSPAVG
jgi:hypothetical protein